MKLLRDPAALDSGRIAFSNRKAMDRITFNPRMMVNTNKLDLTTPLFGENLFAFERIYALPERSVETRRSVAGN